MQKNDKTEGGTGLGTITKRADRKMESNDSAEIPDRGETSETPGLPSSHMKINVKRSYTHITILLLPLLLLLLRLLLLLLLLLLLIIIIIISRLRLRYFVVQMPTHGKFGLLRSL